MCLRSACSDVPLSKHHAVSDSFASTSDLPSFEMAQVSRPTGTSSGDRSCSATTTDAPNDTADDDDDDDGDGDDDDDDDDDDGETVPAGAVLLSFGAPGGGTSHVLMSCGPTAMSRLCSVL